MNDDKRIDRIPLEELCAPVSAKELPLRCRLALGRNEPLTDAEMAASSAASLTNKLRNKYKFMARK